MMRRPLPASAQRTSTFQLLGDLDAGEGRGTSWGGGTASSPKSSSTVNTADYPLIKHISWVYDF